MDTNLHYNAENQTWTDDNGAYYSPDAVSAVSNMPEDWYSLLKEEQNFNSAEAQKNRDFQEYMSSTSFQRMISDIEKAGYNPWLALNSGGAAMASGSTASSSGSSAASALSSKTQKETADKDRGIDAARIIASLVGTAIMAAVML